MDWLSYYQNLLGERYGRVKSLCRGGSWLYTPEGKVKICVPSLQTAAEGERLPSSLADELLEDDVLFVITDRGIITKKGTAYLFYPEGAYKLNWKK